jgi:hypothetical protein
MLGRMPAGVSARASCSRYSSMKARSSGAASRAPAAIPLIWTVSCVAGQDRVTAIGPPARRSAAQPAEVAVAR